MSSATGLLRCDDLEPRGEVNDPLTDRLLDSDTRWSLDLDNPYNWLDAHAMPGESYVLRE